MNSISARLGITAMLLLASSFMLRGLSHGESKLPRVPLAQMPLMLPSWQGNERPLAARMAQAAGVDDYVNRLYVGSNGEAVAVYVGYYSSQRTGDTIHSPKNCLPGSGWEPVHAGTLNISVPGTSSIKVNEYLIAKGADQQLVLYWYQGRGRVVSSEYWSKIWMVVDALQRNRTDGALVRLVTPIPDGETNAQARLVRFVHEFYPQLTQFLPN